MLSKIKVNKVTADFSQFKMVISGRPKAGKTSLVYRSVVEKFGDADNLLLVAFERGYGALDGINAIDIEDYNDFVTLVDDLINNKDSVPYKIIAIDTLDIMEDLAKEYALRQLSREDEKRYKKMSDVPWGGAWSRLYDVINNEINKLDKAGFTVWGVTHDKDKSFTTREGLEYDKTTLSISGRIRDVFVNMADFIVFIELTKEMENDRLVDKRYIHFRGDSTLEAGSRFQHIPNKIEYCPKNFINTIENAILSEYKGNKDAVLQAKSQQEKEKEKRVENYLKRKNAIDEKRNVELIDNIKNNLTALNTDTMQKIMADYSIKDFTDPSNIETEALEKINELVQ